ncbi:MAG: ribonucleoside triphosphate reductase, partial [Clostridia bacterium]|nr:ribonucleoside triphosphate reductase [Clostridia bacterium]
SRITGYYRPVQNWNAGKAQEFKDRKVYNIERSHLTHQGPLGEGCVSCVPERLDSAANDRFLLFTTKTCPNCRMAKLMLDKAGVPYENIDANEHDGLCKEYGIMQAPTLVAIHNGEARLIPNASNIKQFAEDYTTAKA